MYVHAHLRYLEALARMGEADRLFDALLVVNPIAIADVVPNAAPRQANAYFSSSDADFPDRYAASSGFDHVRCGRVAVKAGLADLFERPGLYLTWFFATSSAFGEVRRDCV